VVRKAFETAAEEPATRTSVRFGDTELTFSAFARAQWRTAFTVAASGAKRALNWAGVRPPPFAAACARPAASRDASATVTGTRAADSVPVAVAPLTRTGSSPVVAAWALAPASRTAAAETAAAATTDLDRIGLPEEDMARGRPARRINPDTRPSEPRA
jgi:hypothetical protein